MSSEMIDRVAAAIHSQSGIMIPFHSLREDNLLKAELRMRAKLAIQAIREPTQEMMTAAIDVGGDLGWGCYYSNYEKIWQSVIDKILES